MLQKIKNVYEKNGTTLWRAATLVALIYIGQGVQDIKNDVWYLERSARNSEVEVTKITKVVSTIKDDISTIESNVAVIRIYAR